MTLQPRIVRGDVSVIMLLPNTATSLSVGCSMLYVECRVLYAVKHIESQE